MILSRRVLLEFKLLAVALLVIGLVSHWKGEPLRWTAAKLLLYVFAFILFSLFFSHRREPEAENTYLPSWKDPAVWLMTLLFMIGTASPDETVFVALFRFGGFAGVLAAWFHLRSRRRAAKPVDK